IINLVDAEVMHAHIPQSVQEVIEKNSGDCKAKSLILVRLLESIGVDAHLILVNYDYDRYIKDGLPSPFIFNHEIVKIAHDGKDYFVDPTWSNRSGELSYRAEPFFSTYLQIGGDSGLLQKPENAPSYIHIEESGQIEIKRDRGQLTLEITCRGMSADLERQSL